MRWIKIILSLLVFLLVIYVGIMYSIEEKKTFVVEKELPYSVDKVFPQFENFQNFVRWEDYFSSNKDYKYTYFEPYEGQGSSMSFSNLKKNDGGEMFIRYVNPLRTIKYELYDRTQSTAYKIGVKFLPKGETTKIIWSVETPKLPLMKRFLTLISEEDIESRINKSIKNLTQLLSGKVEREIMVNQIKYDSIIVEEREPRLLLGINVSTSNKKEMLWKNININHNKLISFVTKDLGKREDEFGFPILLTEVGGFKEKEISYFYGVPLSKKESIGDNNFVFRNQEKAQVYSIYYKGKYDNRLPVINKLLSRVKKDSLRNGVLEELFLESPVEDKEVVIKISLPVFK